ncbi:MAG: hypothetical protein EPO11_08750, partial [Gammaproteobacteria bacterium]
MKALLLRLITFIFLSQSAFATAAPLVSPQPTTCITSQFSSTGDVWWKSVVLKLTNNCKTTVDFQDAAITFQSKTALNTSFWGDFSPLSYPDNDLKITSRLLTGGNYLASFYLHFPTNTGGNSLLPAGASISIKYGTDSDGHVDNTTQVYLGTPVETGNIELTNAASKPTNVTQNYALVHLSSNGQLISDIQLPWSSRQVVSGLTAGNYALSVDSVTDTNGNVYQGTATPSALTLAISQTVTSTINYALVQQTGKIAIQLQALPTELSGYTGKPTVLVTETTSGSNVPVTVDWGTSTTVTQLKSGSTYRFSTAAINYNGFDCQPSFNPTSVVANATTAPVTNLTYSCQPTAQAKITLNVNGAPSTLTSLKVTFTPNN